MIFLLMLDKKYARKSEPDVNIETFLDDFKTLLVTNFCNPQQYSSPMGGYPHLLPFHSSGSIFPRFCL